MFPDLILASAGFTVSFEITQHEPIFSALGILPSVQRSLAHLLRRCHFGDICLIDKLSILFSVFILGDDIFIQFNSTLNLSENQFV